MSSIGAVSSEIENGTIHSIITKPIKRRDYILGKYLGLALLVSAYSVMLYFSVLSICFFARLPLFTGLDAASILKGSWQNRTVRV
jgi:ABC-type transport system involved in multi-copper enzyme maturation permease subunit